MTFRSLLKCHLLGESSHPTSCKCHPFSQTVGPYLVSSALMELITSGHYTIFIYSLYIYSL